MPSFNQVRIENIADLPDACGVYIFRCTDNIIYVGKSVNIRARIRSHIESAKIDQKESLIISQSDIIEYVLTDSEFEALVLEADLIKKLKPRYNTRWRDNKSYLYIKITNEVLPKVEIVRQEDDGSSSYFGPFPSYQVIQEVLGEIRRLVPFHLGKIGVRKCFYTKLGQCKPCPVEINKELNLAVKEQLIKAYQKNINKLKKILNGKLNIVIRLLRQELNKFKIDPSNYEQGLVLKNKLDRFENFVKCGVFSRKSLDDDTYLVSLSDLARQLSVNRLNRIECYDVSNLNFREAVAAMVVVTDGKLDKSQYRKFKIKTQACSDMQMMSEVLRRRAKHNDWPYPDLIVIDGGLPQLQAVSTIIADWNAQIKIVGLAKHPDRLVSLDQKSLVLPLGMSSFRLLQQLRDEAHRVCRAHHCKTRQRQMIGNFI